MSRLRRKYATATAVTAVFAVTAVACTGPPLTESDYESRWRNELSVLIASAEEADASEAQLTILARLDSGETLDYDDIAPLVGDVATCFEDVGATFSDRGPIEVAPGSGVLVPDYLVFEPIGMTEAQFGLIYDACNSKYLNFALAAYSSVPVAQEAYDRLFDVDEVRQCLKARGYAIGEETTPAELSALVTADVFANTDNASYAGPCLPNPS